MASETTFDHWKVVFSWGKMRKSRFSQNSLTSRFWAFGFSIYTSSSANFKKDPPRKFFSLSVHAPATSVQCVNIWTTRSCHFDWMSLQNAGQGFRSSDRAAVFGVCGGRWSDRSRYNWLTIDQDGGSLGNSPSPHVVSPSQTNCLPFHFWTKGSSTSCQEWNP